jgi:drug/metabolite transporter (DMT)-like permease
MSILFAGLSALCYGAADYTGGRASRQSSVFAVLVLSQTAGLVGIVVAALVAGSDLVSWADLMWGAAAGASGVIGLSLLYRALASTIAAVASPAAALVGAAAPVIVGALLGEQPGAAGWVGIGLAAPAVLLLTAGAGARTAISRRAVLLGTLAGLGFGGFFIFISQSGPGSGLWPLAASKVISILVALGIARVLHSTVRVERRGRMPAITAGVLDMAANVFFLFASRIGLLAISSVVSSLYPAPTVLLARVLDGQRLRPVRVVGLLLALAGVALMTL